MADNPIPEDLLDSYEECRTALEDTTLQAPALNALRQLTLLIERIGRAEQERDGDAHLICVYRKKIGELEKENAALRVQVKGLEEERHG